MQQVAREFNYSETTFVLPAEHGHDRRVRIFTPSREVPFAGHPNVGTAFVLASSGELGRVDDPLVVTFEEVAGLGARVGAATRGRPDPVRVEGPRGPVPRRGAAGRGRR